MPVRPLHAKLGWGPGKDYNQFQEAETLPTQLHTCGNLVVASRHAPSMRISKIWTWKLLVISTL